MALRTGNFRMHASQRISGLVVIKLRIRTNGFPAGVRMTFLTGNGKRTMWIRYLRLWTAHSRPRRFDRLLRCRSDHQRHDSSDQRDEPTRAPHHSLRIPKPVSGTHTRGYRSQLHVETVLNGTIGVVA